jgi:hypothetical protein
MAVKIKYPGNQATLGGEVDAETLIAFLSENAEFLAALKAYFDDIYVAQ